MTDSVAENRTVIQEFVFPVARLAENLGMYASWLAGPIRLAKSDGSFPFEIGAKVDFGTVANALDISNSGSQFSTSNLGLRISGGGLFRVHLFEEADNGLRTLVEETEITLEKESFQDVVFSGSLSEKSVKLSVVMESLESAGHLRSMSWTGPKSYSDTLLTKGSVRVLQRFIFPDESRLNGVELYARCEDLAGSISDDRRMPLPKGQKVDFTTFFNAFSHRKWHSLSGLRDICLQISGQGAVKIQIISVSQSGDLTVLHRGNIDLQQNGHIVELGHPGQIPGELLSLTIEGTETNSLLFSAEWVTRQPPKRDISLAAVITTFGREEAAKRAASLFAHEIIPGAPGTKIGLFLIDNGRSLESFDLPGVTLIPNRNLGGAGGFTRGLLEVMDSGEFSHVLFMDDDASCEAESIWRTIALLAHATDERLAVSGAMLLAENPHVQHEKGASFPLSRSEDFLFEAQHSDRDLRDIASLAQNDISDSINYGAWWFFAFPVAVVDRLPFPFFVRGDDVDFSISNNFLLTTLNGVGAWCPSFSNKLNPAAEYLGGRAWLALSFMHSNKEVQKMVIRLTSRNARAIGHRLDYAGMYAVLKAMQTVARGPDAFTKEPSPLAQISSLKKYSREVRAGTSDVQEANGHIASKPSLIRRILSTLTLSGHLLPRALKRSSLFAHVRWAVRKHDLWLVKSVIYGDDGQFTIHRAHAPTFVSLLLQVRLQEVRLYVLRHRIQKKYRQMNQTSRSEEFWRAELRAENDK